MANPYVGISDYERVTGTTVPCDQYEKLQHQLDVNVALIERYLGDMADEIFAEHLDPLIIDMVVRATYVRQSVPLGVISESVGSSSVAYTNPQTGLLFNDQIILDDLLGYSRRGLHSIMVSLA